MDNNNYTDLEKLCRELGADIFGVADITEIKQDFLITGNILAKVDRAICFGSRLTHGILEELDDTPDRLYYHHYKTVNAFLDQAALRLGNYIQDKGYLALPIAASQIVDWDKLKGHLSHKKIGYLAGLGWIGRNNLLVHKTLGSQFRLVTVLTDMPLKVDEPTKESCGTCRACIEVCPAKAIKLAPEDFNLQLCFAKLKEFQNSAGSV
ncbi:MAG: hypothetical protein NT033_08750 [Candidatus Omnitrophica bacterium]|nr:hypothetical protein [Candidatus Omnitrophota bacterium]